MSAGTGVGAIPTKFLSKIIKTLIKRIRKVYPQSPLLNLNIKDLTSGNREELIATLQVIRFQCKIHDKENHHSAYSWWRLQRQEEGGCDSNKSFLAGKIVSYNYSN